MFRRCKRTHKRKQRRIFAPLRGGFVPAYHLTDLCGIEPRELDAKSYKYVGVAGVDKTRIVQVGGAGEKSGLLIPPHGSVS